MRTWITVTALLGLAFVGLQPAAAQTDACGDLPDSRFGVGPYQASIGQSQCQAAGHAAAHAADSIAPDPCTPIRGGTHHVDVIDPWRCYGIWCEETIPCYYAKPVVDALLFLSDRGEQVARGGFELLDTVVLHPCTPISGEFPDVELADEERCYGELCNDAIPCHQVNPVVALIMQLAASVDASPCAPPDCPPNDDDPLPSLAWLRQQAMQRARPIVEPILEIAAEAGIP